MLLTEIIQTDLRGQILALDRQLPARWRNVDGSVSWKNPRFEAWLDAHPETDLVALKADLEQTLTYLKGNAKARMSNPYVIRRTRAERTTLRTLLQRAGSRFDHWLAKLFDTPAGLAQCRGDPQCMLDELVNYLQDELSVTIRKDGLIEFWMLDGITHDLIGDLPVVLFHFTSSSVVRSIRADGLEGDRDPVNQRVNPGVYLTTEQSGNAVAGYISNARRAHGGHGVMVTVKCYLNELEQDMDDADIQSGRTQFMVAHVPPDRIVSIMKK